MEIFGIVFDSKEDLKTGSLVFFLGLMGAFRDFGDSVNGIY